MKILDIERLNTYRIQLILKDKDGNIYRGIAQHYGEIE
jgi:hypothetical protein